jgi:hypothetical protein
MQPSHIARYSPAPRPGEQRPAERAASALVMPVLHPHPHTRSCALAPLALAD